MSTLPWQQLEALIRLDPAGRGVASYRSGGQLLAPGALQNAAESLAHDARSVTIVTGFCVFDGRVWTAETDGPPGALYLARALLALGVEVTIITDAHCLPVLEAGSEMWGLSREMLCEMPFEADDADSLERQSNSLEASPNSIAWVKNYLASPRGRRLTHLIAIERSGPSHTAESLTRQKRSGPAPLSDFEAAVPLASRDRCHNMQGADVTSQMAKTHWLFELANANANTGIDTAASAAPPHRLVTIGLADGGNELGMGSIPWETLRHAIRQGPADKVACRIATDYTLLAGVSNWAAYALAASVCVLCERPELLAPWNAAGQRQLIQALVNRAGAVDGMTKRHEATVDGLPLETYLQTLTAIGELLLADGGTAYSA